MKRLISISFILFLVLSVTLNAQPRRISIDDQVKNLDKAVDLSEEQEIAVKKIMEKTREKIMDARDEADGDWGSMREIMGNIRDESNKEIKKLLTDEQKPKYDAFLKEQEEERRKRFQNRNF